jgi:hypothetical protein
MDEKRQKKDVHAESASPPEKSGSSKSAPDESWVDRLGVRHRALTGVTTYIGLVRQDPNDESTYLLYPTLDMSKCLYVAKTDVVHLEELSPEKSPFGSLGGSKLFVRAGAKIKSVRTSTKTFEAGSGSAGEFDLDISLGARRPAIGGGWGDITQETGCGGTPCQGPPFTDPDGGYCMTKGPCNTGNFTACDCTEGCTDVCTPPPPGTNWPSCACPITGTCFTVCQQNTCQTCQTNCGTCYTNCGTCLTHCGTCAVNTCATQCNQQTCGRCTLALTHCQPPCRTP